MGLKLFLSLVFLLVVIALLSFYWFMPISTTDFLIKTNASNFDVGNNSNVSLQFYPNMRFTESRISYKVYDCPLAKKDNMLEALNIISQKTNLIFYESNTEEEISVFCESRNKIEEGLFIAGEGGPTEIIKAGEFNIILNGKILLIRESECSSPNIAIHELLHVLGFDHSVNPMDIMYSVSLCDQEINPNLINLIDILYSIPSYPDLSFENISAVMHGKYLNINISIRNSGIHDSVESTIQIYAEDKLVKELPVESLSVGNGRIISLTNVWINKISVDKIKLFIKYDFDELKKENNEIILEVKK